MKKGSLLPLLLVVTMTPPVYAQNTGAAVVPVVSGGGKGGRMYVGGAGTYRQIEERVTDVTIKVLADARITQKDDIEFVKAAVLEIHQAYKEYADLLISGPILDIQAAGIRGNSTDLDVFLKATAQIKAKKTAFDSLLVKNTSINKSTLPSNFSAIVNTDGTSQQVPSPGQINLSGVKAEYDRLISTELNPQLATMNNIKINVNGITLTKDDYKDLLNPDFSKVPPLSPAEDTRMTNEIEKLRAQVRNIGADQRREFADALRNEYNDFSRRWGADYKYIARSGGDKGIIGKAAEWLFGNDESNTKVGKGETVAVPGVVLNTDVAERNASFKRLIDSFYLRSYLRLAKGYQIGAMQPKMVKNTNFGAFEAIEALKELRTETAMTKVELENALQYSRLILKYTGIQADKVFTENFMSAGLLNKLGSAVTFTLGNRQSAEALHMLIQLVYADIQEELLMATPGQGLQALRAMYVARYQSTPESKAYYAGVRCSVDYDAESCKDVPRDAFSETASVGAEKDVLASFISLRQRIDNAKTFAEQANVIDGQLQALRAGRASAKNEVSRKKQL